MTIREEALQIMIATINQGTLSYKLVNLSTQAKFDIEAAEKMASIYASFFNKLLAELDADSSSTPNA